MEDDMNDKDASAGWVAPTPPGKRPWYWYLAVAAVTVIAGGMVLMVGSVLFFGLIAGW
jgi:hypothetical protein